MFYFLIAEFVPNHKILELFNKITLDCLKAPT